MSAILDFVPKGHCASQAIGSTAQVVHSVGSVDVLVTITVSGDVPTTVAYKQYPLQYLPE
jgi:hypothetical protein